MSIIRIEPLYLGRQFTSIEAQAAVDTSARVIKYDEYPKFHARAWDDQGIGEDIWFEITLRQRTPHFGPPPLWDYTIPGGSTFRVNSRNDPEYFFGQQYYKSGEVCTVDYDKVRILTNNLANPVYAASFIWSLQWIAYDRTSDSSAPNGIGNQVEFSYIPEARLAKLEDMDFISFDRATIFRPDMMGNFVECETVLNVKHANLREPFESAAKSITIQIADPEGMYLPQSEDSVNYIGAWPVGTYSPVFRLGNMVAYETSIAQGIIPFGVTNLITYTDQSRYLGRVWTLPTDALRKEPWVRQTASLEYWDAVTGWTEATEGNEYSLFQYGVIFRDIQTAVRASGQYYNCVWDYHGMFYMAAPTYTNDPNSSNVVNVDCQDRLSLLDSNGRVYLSTAEIQRFATLNVQVQDVDADDGVGLYWNSVNLKTWQDPDLPAGLLLWFHDVAVPYGTNWNPAWGSPVELGRAAIWNDDFEIFVEWYDESVPCWKQLDEDTYDRTIYGILFNKDWSPDLPWTDSGVLLQERYLRITYQIIVNNTNPINEIIRDILEYPNYDEVNSQYGGPGLVAADYSIPGIGAVAPDVWMMGDLNRFIWNHHMGSVFDAIKEIMKMGEFPYNYRVTAEPNPGWTATPFDPTLEDIITFREVTQQLVSQGGEDIMLMLSAQIQQKIEEDRQATIVRSRVFDDFSRGIAVEYEMVSRILWGPGNSAGASLPYEGGFNRNPNTAYTANMLELRREKDPFWITVFPENAATGDISNSWRVGFLNQLARGVVTDNDIFTHLRWKNDSKQWGEWPDFIPTPVVEIVSTNAYELAAIDIRNGEWYDIIGSNEWATGQHMGVKYGLIGDRVTTTTTLSVAVNRLSGAALIGLFPAGELEANQATIEIAACPTAADRGNTYPVIAYDPVGGTLDIAIQDASFAFPLDTLAGQLGNPGAGTVGIHIKNYKWLPKFNRIISQPQETISWELDGYALADVHYLEVWCIKPMATSMQTYGGASENDQFFNLGSMFIYGSGTTVGLPIYMRVRDGIADVPDESEDIVTGTDEFYRPDLIDRMGIRTQVLPDDKAIVDFDFGFMRTGQALYENIVNEDAYQITGVYFPLIPRYSTIVLNFESMGIAFAALLESRNLTFSGNNRSYSWTLKNYNNSVWDHPSGGT